jgi:penicillin-binding protein
MSGAVAVGSLVVVIELGAPTASNLGLGVGLPSVGHGGSAAQAFADPNFPTLGSSATSVVNATSPAPVVPVPTNSQTTAYDEPVLNQGVTATTSGGSPMPSAADSAASSTASSAASSHVVPAAATATTTTTSISSLVPSASNESASAQASVGVPSRTAGSQQQSPGDQQGGGDQHGGDVQSGGNGRGHDQQDQSGSGDQHGEGEQGNHGASH